MALTFEDRVEIAQRVARTLDRSPTLRPDDPPVFALESTGAVRVHVRWRHRPSGNEEPGWIEIDPDGRLDFRHLRPDARAYLAGLEAMIEAAGEA